MSQVTGKKVATTPMPTPSGTSGAIIDSFNTQDDQTVNAPSIHIVKDALTTINDNLISIKISTSYTCNLKEKGGTLGGYVGNITLTDVPANCFLIMPIGGARNNFDGGRYGVVGNYNLGNTTNTLWYVNGAEAGDYYVRFAYFCRNN